MRGLPGRGGADKRPEGRHRPEPPMPQGGAGPRREATTPRGMPEGIPGRRYITPKKLKGVVKTTHIITR